MSAPWRWLADLLRVDRPLLPDIAASPRPWVVLSGTILVGVLAGLAAYLLPHPITLGGVGVGDIGPPAISGKLFLDGASPYQVTLKGVAITLYPFTTSLALMPLLLVSPKLWAPLFAAIVSAALAWAILRRGEPWRLLIFLSLPFWSALYSVQWSPLFAAALLAPAFLPAAAVKPQLGVVLALCGRWTRTNIAATIAFVALSVVLLPVWPLQWIRQGRFDLYEGRSPVLVGIGIVLLSCLFLWRDGRGRLLLAASIVSQRYFYDQLLLFVIPRNAMQMVMLLAASWAGAAVCYGAGWWVPKSGVQEATVWHATIVTIFLPCLAMVWVDRVKGGAAETGSGMDAVDRVDVVDKVDPVDKVDGHIVT